MRAKRQGRRAMAAMDQANGRAAAVFLADTPPTPSGPANEPSSGLAPDRCQTEPYARGELAHSGPYFEPVARPALRQNLAGDCGHGRWATAHQSSRSCDPFALSLP